MSQPQSTFLERERWQEHMDRVFKIKEQKDRLEESGKLVEDLRKLELPPAAPEIDGGRGTPVTDYKVKIAQRRADRARDRLKWNRPPLPREEGVKEKYATLKDLDEKSRKLELQLRTSYPEAVTGGLPLDLTRVQTPSIRSSGRLRNWFGLGSEEPVTREAVHRLEDSCRDRNRYLDAFETDTRGLITLSNSGTPDGIATANQPTQNGNSSG